MDFKNAERNEITVSSDNKIIGICTMYADTKLEGLKIEEGTVEIGYGSFSECPALKYAELPSTLTHIGNRAFSNCASLTEVKIFSDRLIIGNGAFKRCKKLTLYARNGSDAQAYALENGIPFEPLESAEFGMSNAEFGMRMSGHSKSSSESDERLASGSHAGSEASRNAESEAGRDAEKGKKDELAGKLASALGQIKVSVPNKPISVEVKTPEVKAPDVSVGKIETPKPSKPSQLNTPKKTKSQEKKECTLEELRKEWAYRTLSDGTISLLEYKGANENIVVPKSVSGVRVSTIGEWAFSPEKVGISTLQKLQNQGIKSVEIPDEVTRISANAFKGCKSLKRVRLPKSLNVIEGSLFYQCEALENIEIPEGVFEIQGFAFALCRSFTSITVPDSVTKLGDYVFAFCNALKEVKYSQSLSTIPHATFRGCPIEYFIVPSTVKSIAENALSATKRVFIPKSVTSIHEKAFAFSHNLQIYTEKGAYAERFAKNHDVSCDNSGYGYFEI